MKSYCKGQQTTPKPTCTKPFTANFLTKIDAHNRQMAKAKTVPTYLAHRHLPTVESLPAPRALPPTRSAVGWPT